MGTKLSVQDLRIGFGDETVIDGISMDIPGNEVTAIIGPSGCGKTTFLRSINRMHDHIPAAWVDGNILLDGQDIYQDGFNPVQLRIRVGMVFQKPNPFPTMSVRDNITFAPKKHGMHRTHDMDELVEDVLRRAALWDEVEDRLNAPATGLSGGQQQRLCIARALAVEPDVLLMDEPASALDPVATGKIEELILELKETYTVVIVTHNMHQAARISDRTAFFYMGSLVEYDDTDILFENPSEQRTEDYITGRFG